MVILFADPICIRLC